MAVKSLTLALSLLVVACAARAERPLFLAHYMPWFQSQMVSGSWGWHWTMGKMNPESGKGATHFKPLIGFYDSSDPDVVEYHALTMKLAGMDGVLIDWYGIHQVYDYPFNQRCTQLFIDQAAKIGLKVGIVYEDQTLKNLAAQKAIVAGQEMVAFAKTMDFLENSWFNRPYYLRWQGRPLFLVFGPQFVQDWGALFGLPSKPALLTLHYPRTGASGAFAWPLPDGGFEPAISKDRKLYQDAQKWPTFMAVAYPRFQGFYAEAGVHASWGRVEDRNGSTMKETLQAALESKAPFVQFATWNDWGEGTQIEPSAEYGFRDLEVVQTRRKKLDPSFSASTEDLKLPLELYRARKSGKLSKGILDRVAGALATAKFEVARKLLGESQLPKG